ncbi:hypothetical protein [Brevibacillus choshinensis]|uniref:hypothetical protein n=1 Tax=Brevibacillus choshinensis TaxID=54911 RepID=UPI002E2383EF|nr:hypothetical protein [Brevibacillus choshinensis]
MKKLIVRYATGEILCIADDVRIKPNGYQAGEYIFPNVGDLYVIDVPDVPAEAKPYEWCYKSPGGFYKNPDFVLTKTTEEQLKEATAQIANLNRVVARMSDDQLAFMEDVLSMLQ